MNLVDIVKAIAAGTTTTERPPLLPLREGVWYKTRKGEFARHTSDLGTDKGEGGRARRKFFYYKKQGGRNDAYDWWWVYPDTGLRSGAGATNEHDIVAYADDQEPTTADLSSALPLKEGVAYRARNGGKVVPMSSEPDSDGDVQCRYTRPDGTTDHTFWRARDGKTRNGGTYDDPDRDIVGLWAEPAAAASQPKAPITPDAAPLLASLLHLNRQTVEAAAAAAAQIALEQHKAGLRTQLVTEIAKALEQPIQQLVAEKAASQVTVRELVIKDRAETRAVASPHPSLAEAVEISRAINNIWLCGPAGSGKTTLAHQLADALGLAYSFISCTAGMSEAKLLGRMNVQGTYLPAEFVRIYEEGGVFLWDEFDAADPNVVLCANAAMANGHLSVPDRVDRPVATRHPNTILIVATNTWGRGSTSEYTARETLDAATRDRFVLSKIAVDYAPSIEWQFLGGYDPITGPVWRCPEFRMSLPNILARIRANIEKHHLRRVLSTRAFAQGAALRAIGWDDRRIVERYFLDWTEQERSKALEGVS